ncbi:MAG: hypothetical protein AMXMBFR84_50160 [Candidatus Hydrogenedentota bacterium]
MKHNYTKRILAIDPGTRYLGYAVLHGGELLYHGVKVLPPGLDKQGAVQAVRKVGNEIIGHLKPNVLAIEVSFRGRTPRMSTHVAIVRTLARLGKQHGLKIRAYSPSSVRKFLCGLGGANKRQVAFMVTWRFPELRSFVVRERRWKERFHGHMFDAVAVGLKAQDDLK